MDSVKILFSNDNVLGTGEIIKKIFLMKYPTVKQKKKLKKSDLNHKILIYDEFYLALYLPFWCNMHFIDDK